MKRLAALAAILAMAAVQSVALADSDFTYPAEYTGGSSDSAKVGADDVAGYSTVLITKDEPDGEIVYVNQADSAYSGAQNFLLKSNPAVGKYKVLLGSGSNNASPKETYFYVGVDSDEEGDLAMNRLRNEESGAGTGTYNIAYYAMVPAGNLNSYNSLKVGYKEGNSSPVYGGFDLSEGTWVPTYYTGNGNIYVIFQLNDVPNTIKDSVAVYLSEDTVSSSLLNGGNGS